MSTQCFAILLQQRITGSGRVCVFHAMENLQKSQISALNCVHAKEKFRLKCSHLLGGNPLERNSNPNKTHTKWPSSFVDSAERGPNNTPLLRWTDLQLSRPSSLSSRQHTTPVQTSQVKWKKMETKCHVLQQLLLLH